MEVDRSKLAELLTGGASASNIAPQDFGHGGNVGGVTWTHHPSRTTETTYVSANAVT